ncbi:hypothetical protein [Methylobacterium sp. JK268]
MTLPAFHAGIDGFLAAHAAPRAVDVTEDEYARILAEEMAAGRA